MIPTNVLMGIFFFCQTGVGILGNSSLLLSYFLSEFTGKTAKPKDLILKHLTFANSLTIISRGIPQTGTEFGLQYFLNDIGCKLFGYLYRVSRGISLCTTCLLSCFQAITINPRNTRWMKLKHGDTKYIHLFCLLSWLFHLLLNSGITMGAIDAGNVTTSRNVTEKLNNEYCAGFVSGYIAAQLYLFLLSFADVVCLGFMAWASGSMVSTLYRHRRQVQYIHSAHHSPRVSPEARATQTILILVCTFVTFYSLSFILILYFAVFNNPWLWLVDIVAFLETCFPTLCPFILISNKNSVSRLLFPCWRKR